ncbi:Dihydrodipicolinate reductase [Candidatus Portiera aleyrodidarum]|uniref:4-hydroxy-tetrahydrodipicolinate reductase n=1 Tax=Candidatus Portiera aleyrodidarum TaxID=91844 RepID=UPI0005DA0152|nr:4-hydroxy-tetrahydrodipicolinate reductase [Candidatus Portiera aleyrodidarum]CEL12275.1 Dihydrodipicolinate reductase [Candidatus Portiera aleyrodidarum]
MIKVIILGAIGRIGKLLIKTITSEKNFKLIGAVINPKNKLIGKDIGEIIGLGKLNIKTVGNIKDIKNKFDTIIDFTNTKLSLKNLEYCYKNKKSIIIGTTGFKKKQLKKIKMFKNKVPFVLSSNMSIGANIISDIIIKITKKLIIKDFDIEIIEYHHNKKIDCPSGTALFIGKKIAKIMGYNLNTIKVYLKKNGPRIKNTIGYSIIRAGDIIGEHKIIYASKSGEIIEINHKVTNRLVFAFGALVAAKWIKNKKNGYYNMQDVLKEEKKFV